jgi:hypothetical protein
MVFRRSLGVSILLFSALACLNSNAQAPASAKTKKVKTCENFCYALILEGRLIDTLDFSQCTAISGMTCHIYLKDGAQLPSRVFMQPLDSQDKPLGKKLLLIYPALKPKERGWATFLGTPNDTKTVVLTGEWNGAYRSAY